MGKAVGKFAALFVKSSNKRRKTVDNNINLNAKSKIIKVRIRDLHIHPKAQRALIPALVKRIADNLDLDAVGVLHAVQYKRGNSVRLLIVDGQHRIVGIITRAKEGNFPDLLDWEVDVLVHPEIKTDAEACRLFVELNEKRAVERFYKFNALVIAGDPSAGAIKHYCDEFGLRIVRGKNEGGVCCVVQLENAYKLDAGASLRKALRTVTKAWDRDANAVDGKMISGLSLIYKHHDGAVDEPGMINALSRYTGGPGRLLNDARGYMRHGRRIGQCVAETIIDTYNLHRRSGRLEKF
jgi:hypothetical protein